MAGNSSLGKHLIIVCGLSFAGKSTLARAIVERFGYAEVDVDETKFRFYGPGIVDAELAPEDWVRIYAETDRLIQHYLASGQTVVDASRNFSLDERNHARQVASSSGAPVTTIYIDTPESIVRRRLDENRAKPSRRDITDSDFEDVIRAMQPPAASETPLVFHYTDGIETWMSENTARLAPRLPQK